MKLDIEKFIENEGKKIADNIFLKYGEDPIIKHKTIFTSFWDFFLGGRITQLKVEKEVYERALHEATAFFIENSELKFDDKVLKIIKSYIKTRSLEPKKIEKLNQEETLANAIKFETLDLLVEKGLVL